MVDILLSHWATYVYLAQLLILLIAVLRSGVGQHAGPAIMQLAWDRITAHFAWPLRQSSWQLQGRPFRWEEAIQLTCTTTPVPADALVHLETHLHG